MAMNFWEAQRKARSKTAFYLIMFVILTLIAAVAAEYALRALDPSDYSPPGPYVGGAFILVIFGVACFQYLILCSEGGAHVARAVGAVQVLSNDTDPKIRQLCNIVEEMALAASQPTPEVFVLEAKEINAFAAGMSPDKAVITVTTGALEQLNRDELQGVIGHEIGHVYNGDSKISLRLAAMLMGFYFALYIGLRIIQFGGRARSSNGKGGNVIPMIGLIFIGAGLLTWAFGTILKATVSRQREYLADACAVQFTRSTEGIANALRKIEAAQGLSDMPKTGMAYSHLYFNSHSWFGGLLDTHPPLDKRIAAIEGKTYLPPEWK